MRLRISIFALALMAGLTGCWRTFTGIYFLEPSRADVSASFTDLASETEVVLKNFGFRSEPLGKEVPGLASWKKVATDAGQYPTLDGADARIVVAVNSKSLTITIRDLDSSRQTDFVTRLRHELEGHLAQRYGLVDLVFERQWDFLAPP